MPYQKQTFPAHLVVANVSMLELCVTTGSSQKAPISGSPLRNHLVSNSSPGHHTRCDQHLGSGRLGEPREAGMGSVLWGAAFLCFDLRPQKANLRCKLVMPGVRGCYCKPPSILYFPLASFTILSLPLVLFTLLELP